MNTCSSNDLSITRRSRRFDTLVFDVGKVLVDFDSIRALRQMNGRTPHTADEMRALLRQARFIDEFEKGRLTTEDFFQKVAALLKLDIDFESFIRIWGDIFATDLILDESFLQRFKSDYRLLVLSNTNAMHMEFLKARFPVLQLFDQLILSYEVGAMKPDEAMYQAAMRAAGCSPERIFYVDDIAANVEAAVRMGWSGVVFKNKAQLEAELARLGI